MRADLSTAEPKKRQFTLGKASMTRISFAKLRLQGV